MKTIGARVFAPSRIGSGGVPLRRIFLAIAVGVVFSAAAQQASACRSPDGHKGIIYDQKPAIEPGKIIINAHVRPVETRFDFTSDGQSYRVVSTVANVEKSKQSVDYVAIVFSDCSFPFRAGYDGYIRGKIVESPNFGRVLIADQETAYARRKRHQHRKIPQLER